jgi:Na+/H+ antiporter NhaD/arsenite permease-like protein
VFLLGAIVGVSAFLSAVLTNNVVAVAMAPLLVDLCAARRLNPVPYLLALACASNVGSAATIIGSAQNVIIAQRMNLSFAGFTADTGLPALLSLPVVWMVIAWGYRNRWRAEGSLQATAAPATPLDLWETIKGLIVIIGVLVAFVTTDWSRSYVALVGAALLLLNRRIASKEVLHNVDGDLLLMLFGLFVVNQAFADLNLVPGWIADLQALGIDLHSPGWLYLITMAVSDVIGNTPAAMLLAPYAEGPLAGASMALSSALSSNLVVFGSLAGIIVVNTAAARDITVSFGEFSRVGVPITVITMTIGFGWLWLRMAT